MRTSCNGCRVLRKGCSEDCVIRPSIEWMHSPDSQANATLFLAKFYGRAGLLNLLSAAHPHTLRPAIFKSLLYEACGRIVDPVNGSAGLMYSGQWQHCEAAVEAVLKGLPILQLQPHDPSGSAAGGDHVISPDVALKLCDIRHVSTRGHCSVHRRTTSNLNVAEAMDHDYEDGSLFSNETVEPKSWTQPGSDEPGLELTLGMTHYHSTCWL